MTTTVQSIIGFLESRTSSTPLTRPQLTALVADLKAQINQLSVAVPRAQSGATTLLYSGGVGDGVHTGVVADAIAAALNSDRQYGQHQEEQVSMTFINELIPETEKEKFTFPVEAGYGGSKPTLWKWTIDRERNAFLVTTNILGGGYEGTPETHHYVLSWKGDLIHFAGDPVLSDSAETGQVLSWQVHHLVIPPALESRKEEVLQLIREAFEAMGLLYKRERVAAVRIKFDLSTSH